MLECLTVCATFQQCVLLIPANACIFNERMCIVHRTDAIDEPANLQNVRSFDHFDLACHGKGEQVPSRAQGNLRLFSTITDWQRVLECFLILFLGCGVTAELARCWELANIMSALVFPLATC